MFQADLPAKSFSHPVWPGPDTGKHHIHTVQSFPCMCAKFQAVLPDQVPACDTDGSTGHFLFHIPLLPFHAAVSPQTAH